MAKLKNHFFVSLAFGLKLKLSLRRERFQRTNKWFCKIVKSLCI